MGEIVKIAFDDKYRLVEEIIREYNPYAPWSFTLLEIEHTADGVTIATIDIGAALRDRVYEYGFRLGSRLQAKKMEREKLL